MFVSPDIDEQKRLREVMATFPDCVKEYESGPFADPHVVAQAISKGLVVLTFEKYDKSGRKPKIANMCKHFGVEYMNTHDMFRTEKMTF